MIDIDCSVLPTLYKTKFYLKYNSAASSTEIIELYLNHDDAANYKLACVAGIQLTDITIVAPSPITPILSSCPTNPNPSPPQSCYKL